MKGLKLNDPDGNRKVMRRVRFPAESRAKLDDVKIHPSQ